MKKKFDIQVTYFKASGKMYITDTFELEATPCGIYETCYMQDIVDYFKQLQKDNCEQGYPQLIVPE